jgi:flagellar motor switch/type III secretory pathway protein FliN
MQLFLIYFLIIVIGHIFIEPSIIANFAIGDFLLIEKSKISAEQVSFNITLNGEVNLFIGDKQNLTLDCNLKILNNNTYSMEVINNMTLTTGQELVENLTVKISFELGQIELSLKEINDLKIGKIIPTNITPNHPINLSVNGKVIAQGELVLLDGILGIQIVNLI